MSDAKNRRRLAWEAAKLLQGGNRRDWREARLAAARQLFRGRVPAQVLPDEPEIRAATLALTSGTTADTAEASSEWRVGDDEAARFAFFRSLLQPLETVLQRGESHPEGDVLYHSLQVFALVREEAPYDEELLLAALLHDVGKVADPREPVAATVELLGDSVTMRTRWLIENHRDLRAQYDGSISARRRRHLRRHPWYEDLELLAEADEQGREPGVPVPETDEALEYIAGLETAFAD